MILIDILLGVFIVGLIFATLLMLSLNIPGVYMFLYVRDEWRYWREFSRNVDKFEYEGLYEGDGKSHVFIWEHYKAIVWVGDFGEYDFDGYASVHSGDREEVLATMFWRSKSKKFADKLICKLPTELK